MSDLESQEEIPPRSYFGTSPWCDLVWSGIHTGMKLVPTRPRSFPLFSSPLQFFLPFFNLIPSSVNRKVPSSLVLSLFLEMWYTRWMVRLSFHPLSICPVGQSMFDLLPKSGRHRSEVCVLYTISRSLFPVWGRWATSSGHRVGSMFEVVG